MRQRYTRLDGSLLIVPLRGMKAEEEYYSPTSIDYKLPAEVLRGQGGFQMELYSYNKCGTCRKAVRFLEDRKVKFELIDITEITPPTRVLKAAMKAKGMKKLFNTSGGQYRELKLKDKLKTMTESQALDLLTSNGMLIKRPIAVDKNKITVGFNLEEYKKVW